LNSAKATYRTFCQQQKDLPIFSQAWYLDTVCDGGTWDVVLVERGGKIVATMPYFVKRKAIFDYITQPHLCKWLGPYIIPEFRRLKQEQKLLPELIAQLPKVAVFNQNFHYQLENWMPFMWADFQQTTYYTYVIDLSNLEKAYQNIDGNYRRSIQQLPESLKIVHDRSIQEFYEVSKMSLERKSVAFPFSLAFLKKFDEVMQKQDQGKPFFVVDEKDQIHSATYLVWDQDTAYTVMSSDDPKLRKSNSGLFLTWETMKFTKEVLGINQYDFVGSMLPEVQTVRRKFGARQVPYFNVRRTDSFLMRIIRIMKA